METINLSIILLSIIVRFFLKVISFLIDGKKSVITLESDAIYVVIHASVPKTIESTNELLCLVAKVLA
jgi:hypothetical protein